MLGACGIECADGAEQQVVDTDVLPPEYLADLYQKKESDPDVGVDLPITWGPVPKVSTGPRGNIICPTLPAVHVADSIIETRPWISTCAPRIAKFWHPCTTHGSISFHPP